MGVSKVTGSSGNIATSLGSNNYFKFGVLVVATFVFIATAFLAKRRSLRGRDIQPLTPPTPQQNAGWMSKIAAFILRKPDPST